MASTDASRLAAALASEQAAVLDMHKVCYSVKVARKKRVENVRVLHDVNLTVGSGNNGGMLSILGRSGAGKSSLLNVISQRGTGARSGQILLNGMPLQKSDKLRVGYVEQGDELPAYLTPREHLNVYAELSGTIGTAPERRQRVDLVLRVLELSGVSESRSTFARLDPPARAPCYPALVALARCARIPPREDP